MGISSSPTTCRFTNDPHLLLEIGRWWSWVCYKTKRRAYSRFRATVSNREVETINMAVDRELYSNNISGKVPPELGNLINLVGCLPFKIRWHMGSTFSNLHSRICLLKIFLICVTLLSFSVVIDFVRLAAISLFYSSSFVLLLLVSSLYVYCLNESMGLICLGYLGMV